MKIGGPRENSYTTAFNMEAQNRLQIKKNDQQIGDVAIRVIPHGSIADKAKAVFLRLFSWNYVKVAQTNILVNITSVAKRSGLDPARIRELALEGENAMAKGIAEGIAEKAKTGEKNG